MKKNMFLFAIIVVLLFSGCSSEKSGSQIEQTNNATETKITQSRSEVAPITVKGEFTASVIDIIPDYVQDDVPRILLVALFQSKPFLLEVSSELLEKVSPQKQFRFVIEDKLLDESNSRVVRGNEKFIDNLSLSDKISMFDLEIIYIEEVLNEGMGSLPNRIIFE